MLTIRIGDALLDSCKKMCIYLLWLGHFLHNTLTLIAIRAPRLRKHVWHWTLTRNQQHDMVREACLSRRLSPIVVAVASLLTAGLISCFHDHFCYIFTCLTHHNRLCYCDGWNVSLETKEKALQDQKDLCGYCRGYESVDRVSDVSCEEFMQVYGLTGRPVIVTDAMKDWNVSALVEGLQNMSLQTYRNLYKEAVDLGTIDEVFGSFFDILSSPADASPDRERYSTPEKFFTTADDVIMNDTWYINWITNEKAIYDYLNQAVKGEIIF